MKKRLLSAALAVCMIFGSAAALPDGVFSESTSITASAETSKETSGWAGKNVRWTLKNGVVTFSGKGDMLNTFCTPLFDNREDIKSVVIEPGVTSIGGNAFYYCDNITSVSIPNTVRTICHNAFYFCQGIKSIIIPKSVETIGFCAFGGCFNLKKVTIPKSVKKIEGQAFRLTSWLFDQAAKSKNSLVIINGILIDGSYCEEEKLIIPSSVVSIGEYAFEGCRSIKTLIIPDNVKNIGQHAFYSCDNLKSVSIPKSIISFDYYSFYECSNLTTVTIQEGAKIIGDSAFEDCNKLKNITIPKSVTSIGSYAFSKTKWLDDQRAKNPLVIINGIVIDGQKCTGSLIIPDTVKSIIEGSFRDSIVTSVTIPNGIKSIPAMTFYNSANLKKISIPNSVTSIGYDAFFDCINLKSVSIPKSVTKIGSAAFGFYYDSKAEKFKKVSGFTIYGYKGTAAEKYAKDNGFKFVPIRNPEPKSTRLAGANRYETASIISKKMNPKTSGTVIIATGLTFHDAMVAVPMASAHNAPLLLATEKHITAQTEAELKRLKARNVIVVSTNGAIGAKAKAEFKALKYKMTYIEGKTCFETAAKVAKALQTKTKKAPDTIFFATDSAFADALSASPVAAIKGAPIIYLKKTGSIDSATANYLKSVKGKVKNAYIIGGDRVISNAMMKNVAKTLGLTVNKNVQRVAGANRYETCVAVNKKFKNVLPSDGICVAKGLDFPDALAGGVYAASTKQALFLADGKKLLDCQNTYLKGKNAAKITVFGGTNAVPDSLVNLIAKASI